MKPDLQAIREREKRATEGPWHVNELAFVSDSHYMNVCRINETVCFYSDGKSHSNGRESWRSNATFIAASRQDIPDLLEYIEKLEAVVEGAREAKQAWFTSADYTRYMDIFHGIQKIEKSLKRLDGDKP